MQQPQKYRKKNFSDFILNHDAGPRNSKIFTVYAEEPAACPGNDNGSSSVTPVLKSGFV